MHILDVKIMKLDKPNKNGRTYPSSEIEKHLDRLNVKAEKQALFGELGYPKNADEFRFSAIKLENASHSFSNLRIEDGYLVADVKILQTPMGNIVEKLYDQPNTGFGIRATGDVDEHGVVTNLDIFSFDFINDPA